MSTGGTNIHAYTHRNARFQPRYLCDSSSVRDCRIVELSHFANVWLTLTFLSGLYRGEVRSYSSTLAFALRLIAPMKEAISRTQRTPASHHTTPAFFCSVLLSNSSSRVSAERSLVLCVHRRVKNCRESLSRVFLASGYYSESYCPRASLNCLRVDVWQMDTILYGFLLIYINIINIINIIII